MSEREPAAHPPGEPETAPQDAPAAEKESTSADTVERDEGPVRRPLIRATLKLPEGTPPTPRQAPVFTMHEPRGNSAAPNRGNSRPRHARSGRDNGQSNQANGNKSRSRSRSGSSRRGKGRSR